MLRKLYVDNQYILCSDQDESTEEFIDMYITIIEDMLHDHFKDDTMIDLIIEKLNTGNYLSFIDRNFETECICVYTYINEYISNH